MRLSLVLVLLLAACSSQSSDFGSNPDITVESATRLAQVQGAGEWTDVQVGHGRVVQPGRKITATFTVSDTAGRVIGEGPVVYAYGETKQLRAAKYLSTGVAADVAAMLGGMQVGGKRHFEIPRTRCGNTAYPVCVASGPNNVIQYPINAPVVFDVEVLAVCTPKIALVTYHEIPKSEYTRAEERSCQ